MKSVRSKRALALSASLMLAVAACSSDSDTAEPETEEVETEADEADTEAEETETETEAEETETEADEAETEADEAESEADEAESEADEAEEEAGDAEVAEEAPSEPTGEPIKIMLTGVIESPVIAFPSAPLGAELAVEEINAAGGVNGRPLELVICNDELDPNVAAGCIQTAASEGVVAVVGGISVFEALVFPLLNDSSIPWIGPATSSDFSTPILFPVTADGASLFAAVGYSAVEAAGCATPAVIYSAQGSEANGEAVAAGIEAAGGTVATILQGNGPDFAPLVESALADGADCIAGATAPPEVAGLVAAVAGRVPITTLDGSLPGQLAASLGDAIEGLTVVGGYRLPAAGDPNVVALADINEERNPGIALDTFWINGYVGAYMVAEVLDGVDDVSAESVLAGLSELQGYDTGFGPIVDFTTPNTAAGYERVFNPEAILWTIEGGEYKLVEGVTYDMQPALELLAG